MRSLRWWTQAFCHHQRKDVVQHGRGPNVVISQQLLGHLERGGRDVPHNGAYSPFDRKHNIPRFAWGIRKQIFAVESELRFPSERCLGCNRQRRLCMGDEPVGGLPGSQLQQFRASQRVGLTCKRGSPKVGEKFTRSRRLPRRIADRTRLAPSGRRSTCSNRHCRRRISDSSSILRATLKSGATTRTSRPASERCRLQVPISDYGRDECSLTSR